MWEPCDGCGPKERGYIALGDRLLCQSCYLATLDALCPGIAAAALDRLVNGDPLRRLADQIVTEAKRRGWNLPRSRAEEAARDKFTSMDGDLSPGWTVPDNE